MHISLKNIFYSARILRSTMPIYFARSSYTAKYHMKFTAKSNVSHWKNKQNWPFLFAENSFFDAIKNIIYIALNSSWRNISFLFLFFLLDFLLVDSKLRFLWSCLLWSSFFLESISFLSFGIWACSFPSELIESLRRITTSSSASSNEIHSFKSSWGGVA